MLKYIWDRIGNRLIQALDKKISGKLTSSITKRKKDIFKAKFIESLDKSILDKYDKYSFYNKLSRVLLGKDTLKFIFEHCYNRTTSQFSSDDEIVDFILKGEIFNMYESIEIQGIIRNIIESTFNALNMPDNDTERKIINITAKSEEQILKAESDNTAAIIDAINDAFCKTSANIQSNSAEMQLQRLQPANTGNILPLEFLNTSKYNVSSSFHAKRPQDYYQIDIIAKLSGELAKYSTMQDYLDYLTFSGCSGNIYVASFQLRDGSKNIIQSYIDNSYNGPCLKFETMYAPDRVVTYCDDKPDDYPDDCTKVHIKIVPQKTTMHWDIINQDFDILISNLHMQITRKVIGENIIECTLEDSRENENIVFSLKILYENGKSNNPNFSIKMRDSNSFSNNLSFLKLLKQFCSAKIIKCRNTIDGNIELTFTPNDDNIEISTLDNTIDLCKKALCIQEFFHVKLVYNEETLIDDIHWINLVYKLITKGFSVIENSTFTFSETSSKDNEYFSREGSYFFDMGIKYVELCGIKIDLSKNAKLIISKVRTERISSGVKVIPESQSVICYEPVFGKYTSQELAQKFP